MILGRKFWTRTSALDDLVVDRDRVADEEPCGEADLVVAVRDPGARQPLEDLRRGVDMNPRASAPWAMRRPYLVLRMYSSSTWLGERSPVMPAKR